MKKRHGGKLYTPEELKEKRAKKEANPPEKKEAKSPGRKEAKSLGKKAATPKKVATPKKAASSKKGGKNKAASKDASDDLPPGLTLLSEKTLFLGQSLCVIQGNIADIDVDAIVHPTNSKFNLAGEVGKKIIICFEESLNSD